MERHSEGIGIHSFDDDRVDLNDSQLEASNVLIRVGEGRLNLASADIESTRSVSHSLGNEKEKKQH